jgi:hypothetical protein
MGRAAPCVGEQPMSVIRALIEWLAHLGLASVHVLSWFGAGWLLLRRLRTGVLAVDVLNWAGAGAVAFALATFFLGLAGLLYAQLFVLLIVVSAVVGLLALRRAASGVTLPSLHTLPRWLLALGALLAATVVLAAVATGAPVNGYDALLYHVSVPVLFEEQHRVFEVTWSWSSYQPFSVEMLMTDGLLLWDPVQGAFAVFALVLFATAAAAVGGWLVADARIGLLGAAIFLVQPLVAWEATAALVEGGIAFMVALTSLNLLVWTTRRDRAALVAAGLFAGGAAGMKYIGLFALLAAGVALLLIVLVRRTRPLASILAFALPAALVASPWYLKNWVFTGNPLFPFLFGGASEDVIASIEGTVTDFGYGESPLDALLLAIRLLIDSEAFDGSGWLSPLAILVPPLALLNRSLRTGVSVALVACLFYVGCWFFTAQQARFLIPVLPVLSVLASVGLRELLRAGRAGRWLAPAAAGAALAGGFVIFAVYCAQFVPVVTGFETKEQFLADRTAYYGGIEWLNRETRESDRVLIDFPSPYLDRPYVVWTPLVVPGSPSAVRRFVRDERLRYVAVLSVNRPARTRTLTQMRARHVATIDVHTAYLGLRRWGGVAHRLFVYRLPFAAEQSSARR